MSNVYLLMHLKQIFSPFCKLRLISLIVENMPLASDLISCYFCVYLNDFINSATLKKLVAFYMDLFC